MKISFVTPTYNRADLLIETIGSILESVDFVSGLDYELIVVDDASSDDTREVLSKKYPVLIRDGVVIYDRLSINIGVTGAKNRGVELASGDWIVFIDSDDLLIPDTFGRMVAIIKKRADIDLFFFSCETFEGHRLGESFESGRISLSDYIEKGTYGEKLPVIKRELALSFPYEESLRGFESIAYVRILLSGYRCWVDNLICRRYRLDNSDRLSTKTAIFRRAGRLASGYRILKSEFENRQHRVPKKYLAKMYLYTAVNFFVGKNV